MEKKRKTLLGRLTGKFLIWMIVIVLGITYILFYLEKKSTLQFYSEIYHNKMLVTNEYTRRVISDVYVAVTNNLYYLEHSLNNPDGHKATMERIVRSGTRIHSCGVSFVEDYYYPQKGHRFCPFSWRDPAHPDEIYSQNKGDDDYEYLTAKWFLDVVNGDSARWSEPFYDGYDESTALSAYMVPIHDHTGRVVAVLGADISLEWFANKLSKTDSIINKKEMLTASMFKIASKSFIINHDGTYITHSDGKRIMKDNFFQQLEACDGSNRDEVISNITNDTDDNNGQAKVLVDGKECYLFFMPVKYTQWILVTVVPCKALDIVCNLNAASLILIVFLPLLVLVIVGYYYLRNALKPLKQLVKVADDIANGKLDTQMPETRHNDELCQLRESMDKIRKML